MVVLGGSGWASTLTGFFLKPGQLVLGLASTDLFLYTYEDFYLDPPRACIPALIFCCLSFELILFSSLIVPRGLPLLIILCLCWFLSSELIYCSALETCFLFLEEQFENS